MSVEHNLNTAHKDSDDLSAPNLELLHVVSTHFTSLHFPLISKKRYVRRRYFCIQKRGTGLGIHLSERFALKHRLPGSRS